MLTSTTPKTNPVEVQRRVDEGITHIKFACKLYREQMRGGRCFLHEHLDFAKSWGLTEVVPQLRRPAIAKSRGSRDQCESSSAETSPGKGGGTGA